MGVRATSLFSLCICLSCCTYELPQSRSLSVCEVTGQLDKYAGREISVRGVIQSDCMHGTALDGDMCGGYGLSLRYKTGAEAPAENRQISQALCGRGFSAESVEQNVIATAHGVPSEDDDRYLFSAASFSDVVVVSIPKPSVCEVEAQPNLYKDKDVLIEAVIVSKDGKSLSFSDDSCLDQALELDLSGVASHRWTTKINNALYRDGPIGTEGKYIRVAIYGTFSQEGRDGKFSAKYLTLPWITKTAPVISLCDVVREPEKFNDKGITIRGRLIQKAGGYKVIRDDACPDVEMPFGIGQAISQLEGRNVTNALYEGGDNVASTKNIIATVSGNYFKRSNFWIDVITDVTISNQ